MKRAGKVFDAFGKALRTLFPYSRTLIPNAFILR